jgi:hypothetical protein
MMFNIGFWKFMPHGLNEHTVSQSEDEDFLSYVTSVDTEMWNKYQWFCK